MPPIKRKSVSDKIGIKHKTISMKDLVFGLGMNINDIVVVNNQVLTINDLYEFIRLGAKTYNTDTPNLVLGMLSGKYEYTIYKISEIYKVEKKIIGEN